MNDQPDNLSQMLKQWQPHPILAGHIRAGVWSRIEKDRETSWAQVLTRVASWFERPLIAGGVVAIAFGLGIAFGMVASVQSQTEAYLQSMAAFRN
jgi:hypothetical protein